MCSTIGILLQFDWASVEDLEGMSVGATQDYSYNEKLASLVGRRHCGSVDVTTSDEGPISGNC